MRESWPKCLTDTRNRYVYSILIFLTTSLEYIFNGFRNTIVKYLKTEKHCNILSFSFCHPKGTNHTSNKGIVLSGNDNLCITICTWRNNHMCFITIVSYEKNWYCVKIAICLNRCSCQNCQSLISILQTLNFVTNLSGSVFIVALEWSNSSCFRMCRSFLKSCAWKC